MTLGDRELEREELALFDRQAGMLIDRMAGIEPAAVAALAHTLKGSARGIGAWGVAFAAEAVEAAAKPTGDLGTAVSALSRAVAKTRETITDRLAGR